MVEWGVVSWESSLGSRLFFLPWIQRDLRQEDIICGCLPYWYLFQPFFYEKTWLNRDTEWFGRSLEPYWSDRPLKTRRVRGYWTTNRCFVNYLLPQNSVEREIESQTGRKQWTFYLVPWVLFQKKKKSISFVSMRGVQYTRYFSRIWFRSLKITR